MLMDYIRNLIKRAVLTNSPIDTGGFQIGQISYLDTITNAEIFHPYGFGSRPPVDSYCVSLDIQGQSEHQICFVSTPDKRIKNLDPGETYFSNLETGTTILNKSNGDMIVTVNGSKKVTISKDFDVVVHGNANIKASGSVTIDSNSIDIGVGGSGIARIGDSVLVDPDTGIGNITSASIRNRSA